jgi:predicted flap endonuclease-1-like 5' DNA nuclease
LGTCAGWSGFCTDANIANLPSLSYHLLEATSVFFGIEGDESMTLTTTMTSTWLAAIFFLQTGGVPIWVPLVIIFIIILIFWWGLTRNQIPDEEGAAGEEQAAAAVEAEEAEVVETAVVEETVEEETAAVEAVEEAEPVEAEEEAAPPEPDDLKLIEGIGPKISELLAEAGITTFAQLAASDVDELERIVRHEGGIRIANPTTWPQQAGLAAEGDWDGLEALQERLVAGREL